MVRLYIDWNVMSQMKAGQHAELSEIVRDKEKFFNVYSTSHIGDIAASDQSEINKENIDLDLEFIQNLTDGHCVYNTGSEILIEQRQASELYRERTDFSEIRKIFEPGAVDKMLNEFDPEMRQIITPAINLLKNLPIDDVFREAFENPDTVAQMRQFLPDLENNYSPEGVFNSFFNMFTRLNENDDYKQLRETLQKGVQINRNKLFDAKEPYQMIDKAYKKFGINLPDTEIENKNAPGWYNELTNEYIRLDMHGYQEDKVSVGKGRKQTFRNTMEDAFHAAFATTCDFYITNDDRNYKKAQVVYEKLRINSLVMKPDEFVAHYKDWLQIKGDRFIGLISAILQHGEPEISDDGSQRTYFGCFFIFDYFNKIYVLSGTDWSIVLSRAKPTNARFLYENELTTLIDKLLMIFGEDIDQTGSLKPEEKTMVQEDRWAGRKWLHGELLYHLRIINGYLQFYLSRNEAQ
jgi:hypothetical protein